jgi:hypothetical protein
MWCDLQQTIIVAHHDRAGRAFGHIAPIKTVWSRCRSALDPEGFWHMP